MTEPTAAVWSLPTDIAEFGNDERISFSRLDNKHIAVQDDGNEYEFDTALRRWIAMLEADLIAAQQSAYFNSISDQSPDARPGKKRKQDEVSRVRRCPPASALLRTTSKTRGNASLRTH